MSDWQTKQTIGPYELNTIITGDARKLAEAIPDESIDLIFTDPVYDKMDDYQWLAGMAARVLILGGNLVAFCSPDLRPVISNMFMELGFTWCDELILRETARRRFNHGRKIVGLYEVAIWVSNGKNRIGKYVDNFSFVSNGYVKKDDNHDWNKNAKGITHWIDRLSLRTVFDPFTGGGTVPAVCKTLGRNYIAFEIDPATADRARERVRNTQPPLFMPEIAQAAMGLRF